MIDEGVVPSSDTEEQMEIDVSRQEHRTSSVTLQDLAGFRAMVSAQLRALDISQVAPVVRSSVIVILPLLGSQERPIELSSSDDEANDEEQMEVEDDFIVRAGGSHEQTLNETSDGGIVATYPFDPRLTARFTQATSGQILEDVKPYFVGPFLLVKTKLDFNFEPLSLWSSTDQALIIVVVKTSTWHWITVHFLTLLSGEFCSALYTSRVE